MTLAGKTLFISGASIPPSFVNVMFLDVPNGR